jgi:catechol 2,3-dioxygenase
MSVTPANDSAIPSLTLGRVVLTVHDLAGVKDFYERAVGLHALRSDGESAELGAGQEVLLELRVDRAARARSVGEAGLFHTAFLLPERANLGSWVHHAIERQIPVSGLADHLVSEAIYLNDPEGNGVEIYADRPRSEWRWTKGEVAMSTDPLDVNSLVVSGQGRRWTGAPDRTIVGHVHLQVGALDKAEAFYRDELGFDVTCHYPGATFYAVDGYHHHVATNVWNSRGAGRRQLPSTGLAEFEIRMTDERRSKVKVTRSVELLAGQGRGEELVVDDPWGTRIRIIRSLG